MTLRVKILASILCLLLSFAVGRYSISQPQVKIQEEIKTNTQLHEDKDTHTTTVTTTLKEPSGEVKTTTTTHTDITAKIAENKDTNLRIQETITPQKRNTLNLSLLVADNIHNIETPLYGISVSKEFIGPVTIGAFGLTNGTIGLSIGVNF